MPAEGVFLRQAIHTRQFWLLAALFFGFGFYLQIIMVHIVTYAKMLEPLSTNPAFIMTIIGALSIGGRILLGASGDRLYAILASVSSVCLDQTTGENTTSGSTRSRIWFIGSSILA